MKSLRIRSPILLKKFTVTAAKSDREAGTSQGDGTLAGAVYGLYQDGTLIDTYTTGPNGEIYYS